MCWNSSCILQDICGHLSPVCWGDLSLLTFMYAWLWHYSVKSIECEKVHLWPGSENSDQEQRSLERQLYSCEKKGWEKTFRTSCQGCLCLLEQFGWSSSVKWNKHKTNMGDVHERLHTPVCLYGQIPTVALGCILGKGLYSRTAQECLLISDIIR